MRLTRLARQITTYRLRAASDGEHRLLIEQPRLAGWSLATPDPTHVELSADAYRIPVTLTASKQNNVVVTMERPLEETIRLLDLADDRLGVLVASNELEPSVKKALGELASQRQALGRQNVELDKLKERRRQLVDDEKRLRDNLAAVGRDTALYKQTLDKLGETEATITNLSTAIEKTAAEIETPRNSSKPSSPPSSFEPEPSATDGRLLRPATNPISNIMTAGGIAERIPRKWMVPIHGRFLGSDDQSIRWTWPNVEIKKPAISNVQHVHPLRGTACVGRRRPVLGRRGARLSHGCGKGGG
jgi:hypothetical protein